MKSIFLIIAVLLAVSLNAQEQNRDTGLDIMLVRGEYENVIDTCLKILSEDSLNAEIWFKLGLAYQNILKDEQALSSFARAVSLKPDNRNYNFMLAKGYYNKGKNKLAEPLFSKLYSNDTLNWVYAFYLTSIYMQSSRFDESIWIYNRFLQNDSANYILLDKKGYAMLKKEAYDSSRVLYEKSLKLNPQNISAIKNLAFLYAAAGRKDTAIYILSRAIDYDTTDMDLYVRRAQLYYSINYNKRALLDYLVILASGDSTELYLKRAGIGYCNNLQAKLAIKYLLIAYQKDSSDYETCSYLGQSYYNLREMKRSIYYYKRVIKILSPINIQTGLSYILLAESLKGDGQYKEAVDAYLKAQQLKPDPNLYMIIANIYDEQFDDKKNALKYYQLFLSNIKTAGGTFSADYLDSIKKRIEFLKENQGK
jgi:tetratricopeptide (TPR) repeat protein